MELEKLRPCPYCGSERIARYVGASHKTMVYCIPCSETYDHAVTMPEKAWNKRPIEDELKERIHKLEELLPKYIFLPTDEEEDDFSKEWDNTNNG